MPSTAACSELNSRFSLTVVSYSGGNGRPTMTTALAAASRKSTCKAPSRLLHCSSSCQLLVLSEPNALLQGTSSVPRWRSLSSSCIASVPVCTVDVLKQGQSWGTSHGQALLTEAQLLLCLRPRAVQSHHWRTAGGFASPNRRAFWVFASAMHNHWQCRQGSSPPQMTGRASPPGTRRPCPPQPCSCSSRPAPDQMPGQR